MRKVIVFLMTLIAASVSAQEELAGKVITIIDGNTMEVITTANESYKIVFAGIDCPELTQEYGDKAKQFLERTVLNKQVKFQLQGKDRWGNYIAEVTINGEDPRIELLKQGLAWTSERNPDPDLEELRVVAQEKGKGLWKEAAPTPPWSFRRQQSMLQAKSS
jgi:micrococcal nuclease